MTKIICFAGRKQSGKSSSCEYVYRKLQDKCSVQIYNFADPLKQICIDVLGLAPRQCYGEDKYKNELVDCQWNGKQLTAREVMQILGTDILRTMQHNVWTGATIRKIQRDKPDLALIGDCRFPNEVEAVQKVGGMVIKLNRNIYHSNHASETALDRQNYDELNFDVVIQNQFMDLEAKNEVLSRILKEKGIL
jgi:hypothetical protein